MRFKIIQTIVKLALFSAIFLLYLTSSILYPVSAHVAGQPPFFMINGKFSNFYHVLTSSLTSFTLPQDDAPDHYLVNTPINFEINTTRMQVPQEIIDQTKFQWDFGDGQKGEGLQNVHTYTKQGSYFIFIYALSPDLSTPQLIESVLLNILPNASYKLPQAVIKINGQRSSNPISDILQIPFSSPVNYNATYSKNGSGSIVSYFWDLGDEQSATDSQVTHQLPNQYYMAFPVLRIRDNNGFIDDVYVQMNNTTQGGKAVLPPKKNSPTSSSNSIQNIVPKKTSYSTFIIVGIVLITVCLLAFIFLKRKK